MAVRSTEEIKKVVKEYYSLLLKSGMPVEKVFLFGSYSRNEQDKDSDIDVAVVLSKFAVDRFNTRLELMKYARDFEFVIEPHPFLISEFDRTHPFAKEILNTGEALYF